MPKRVLTGTVVSDKGDKTVVVDEIAEVDTKKPVTEPKADKPTAKKSTKGKAKAEPEAAEA